MDINTSSFIADQCRPAVWDLDEENRSVSLEHIFRERIVSTHHVGVDSKDAGIAISQDVLFLCPLKVGLKGLCKEKKKNRTILGAHKWVYIYYMEQNLVFAFSVPSTHTHTHSYTHKSTTT